MIVSLSPEFLKAFLMISLSLSLSRLTSSLSLSVPLHMPLSRSSGTDSLTVLGPAANGGVKFIYLHSINLPCYYHLNHILR